MKSLLLGSALTLATAASAFAEPVSYTLDNTHTQIVFHYNHLGFSTGFGMFSGFDGTISFDAEDPANSSVEVAFPAASLLTGIDGRTAHFLTEDFFGAEANDTVSFVSTGIEVTGEDTGLITGDLTINGITNEVVLDAKLNQLGEHPMEGKQWAGFDATATVLRSDYDMGMFAPYVSDEVEVQISIEAMQAE
ncbi:Polyisoprenoid-binding protein YceI [Pseudooceanicola antarcticus]|uniref:Polyisoprenoid-binding protein n=1 Tax=Pseudooceanicola antarcticus TaxID=1247613 RepID=A0A285J6T6_9RHOB|nr:YceI family protein [Pseudooceanicola antarcticus]PJE26990.1 polyisoprenoid-binding protein [Pseudooceanicola antarcticus]SNY56049.1 Polyisoprenoid-binding protein YceI [Pseudooceanicola antarcticus]